jgi:4-amino-4-deoxy-L-arabinose transferase-like glycosyltransferase
LLFFTLSQSKRPQYVLPLVPACALAAAHLWHAGRQRVGVVAAGGILAVLGAGLVLAAGPLARAFPASPDTAALIPPTARWVGGAALVGGLAALALSSRLEWSLVALAFPVLVLPVAGLPLLGAIGRDRSSRELAAIMEPLAGDRTEVVAVATYPLSLPFYLRRPLTLVSVDGRELTSNYVPRRHDRLRRIPGSPLRPPAWWAEALTFCDRPRLFVVPAEARAIRDRLAETLPLVATTRKVAVYGPCGGDALAFRGVGSGEWYAPVTGEGRLTATNHSPLPTPGR